ncbi:NAD(P)-binding protein [Colletotrichum somersetense]|nr:NAD(P)-binding protein [Colletotrichum somersetense]
MLDQALKTIGLVWVLYSAYRLYDALALWILPAVPLTRYQKKGPFESWALVTGASAGIGLGCAQELALRGFNLVLCGHDVDELEDARALIESECRQRRLGGDVAVRLVVLDPVAGSARQLQAAVDGLADLDVTVLVNDAGGVPAQQQRRRLREMSAEDVDAAIDLNVRFMSRLTRLMAPALARNGPSLVLNVGSTTAGGSAPGAAAVYPAAKAFVASFSRALAREMTADGAAVDVLCVAAGEVSGGGKRANPGAPDARAFAKAAVGTAGRAALRGMLEVTPWFRHAAQRAFLERAPGWLGRKLITATHDEKVRKED